MRTFVKWIQSRGARFPGLEIRECDDGSGNGIFSTAYFRANETMISIPPDLMLTAGTIAEMPKYQKILQRTRLQPFEVLVLFFIMEDPSTSVWSPYLKVLPRSFCTPSITESNLNPEYLPSAERALWINQQNEQKTIFQKLSSLVPAPFSYDHFLWAWHVVNTRCIFVENKEHPLIDNSQGDTVAVIPFVDMLNHSASNQGFALWDNVKKRYKVNAVRTVSEGEQVFVCYGGHTNGRLWIEYGFTLPQNPNNKVAISIELLCSLAGAVGIEVSNAHKRVLTQAGLPCTLYASDGAPSYGFRANLRILQMTHEELSRWSEILFDNNEEASDDLVISALKKLREELSKKREKVPCRFRWLWDEQLAVTEDCIQNA